MRPSFRILTLAATLVLGPIASAERTRHYSNLYVFGDSYCDVGNLHAPVPYYQGRWSNGPLWVEHIAGFLGVPLTPSSAGGSDYAWDGAAVTQSNYSPSIPQQVEEYLSTRDGKADPDALFILEGGTNDILTTTSTNPEEIGYQIALGLANSVQRLRAAGARHFVISNLFDIGLLPIAAPKAGFASAAATAANSHLDHLLFEDRQREGVHILRLNTFSLLNAIAKDPSHFGFVDVTDPCKITTPCADPDHWFFFDSVHLTEFAQSDLAVAVETLLTDRGED
jgi:phospholipase/lecithinase/hemolysin